MKTLILICFNILLMSAICLSQSGNMVAPKLDYVSKNDTITKSDTVKRIALVTGYTDVYLHIRNNTGAGADTVLAANLTYYKSILRDSVVITGTNVIDNTAVASFIVAAGTSRCFKLNFDFIGTLAVWRRDAYESGNQEIIFLECGNKAK